MAWLASRGTETPLLMLLAPDRLEIVLARELRKTGLELPLFRVRRRTPLSEDGQEYELLLECRLQTASTDDMVLVRCINQRATIPPARIQSFADALSELGFEKGVLVATTDYEPAAVTLAATLGIALLEIVDGAVAWQRSGMGTTPEPPIWFPALAVQLIIPTASGGVGSELLTADHPQMIPARLRARNVP